MTKQDVLKQYFGYESFRQGQEELIDALLAGRDVLGIMPTGAGKSVCYQVPAMLLPGITVVISPLISLMNDQVHALEEAGVPAACINSSMSAEETARIFDAAREHTFKILYVAPERLETDRFLSLVSRVDVSMVAVDEAHCVSQWGQDFRPSYRAIPAFVKVLKKRPVIGAFTATATDLVKRDIENDLELSDPKVMATGFDRPNLYFDVRREPKRLNAVIRYVTDHLGESGIIYCATRKNVDKVYESLIKEGISSAAYHAGLDHETRVKAQDDFIYDRISVMVATNAFGMGIDKSNVRYVLHYNMPQSLENYYQEAGRAGRDGERSECILFYSPQDVVINRFILSHKENPAEGEEDGIDPQDEYRLKEMDRYCHTSECLRRFIVTYFGQRIPEGSCNNCGNCNGEYESVDVTEQAKQIINCVWETKQRFGTSKIIAIVRGSRASWILSGGYDQKKSYGKLAEENEERLRRVTEALLDEEYLSNTKDQYRILKLTDRIKELNDRPLIIRENKDRPEERKDTGTTKKKRKKQAAFGIDPAKEPLFEKLRELRMDLARKRHVPPYVIFSDKTLIEMCARRPKSEEELLDISGVGEHKKKLYGAAFLEVIGREG